MKKYKIVYNKKLTRSQNDGNIFCNILNNIPSNSDIKSKNGIENLNVVSISFAIPCPSGLFASNNVEWKKDDQSDNNYLKGLLMWILCIEKYNIVNSDNKYILRIYCSEAEYEYLKTYALKQISEIHVQCVIYKCPKYLDEDCKESNHHINLFGKLSRYFVLIDKEINKANIRDGDIKTIDDGFKSIEKYKDYANTFTFGSYNNRGWGELNFDSILERGNYKWYVNENLTSMKEDITKYLKDSNSIIGEYDYNNQWSGEDHNSFISYFNGILDMPIFNDKCKSALHYRTGNKCCENDEGKFLYCTDAIFNHRIVEWLTRNHPDKITLCPIFM